MHLCGPFDSRGNPELSRIYMDQWIRCETLLLVFLFWWSRCNLDYHDFSFHLLSSCLMKMAWCSFFSFDESLSLLIQKRKRESSKIGLMTSIGKRPCNACFTNRRPLVKVAPLDNWLNMFLKISLLFQKTLTSLEKRSLSSSLRLHILLIFVLILFLDRLANQPMFPNNQCKTWMLGGTREMVQCHTIRRHAIHDQQMSKETVF